MRVTIPLLSLLLLPLVVGCEGDTPRRSPLAVTASPSAAKTVEFAPQVKGATPGPRPAGQANPGNPAPTPDGGNPAVPGEANPAAGAPPKFDNTKIFDRRGELLAVNFENAMFLRSEVGELAGTSIQEGNNFVFKTIEGLDKLKITHAMSIYNADKGKPPQTISEFLKFLADNEIKLPRLDDLSQFYIYDPALAAKETSKENLDYITVYSR